MLYTDVDYLRSFSYLTTMNEKGYVINQNKLHSNGEIIDFLKGLGRKWGILVNCIIDVLIHKQ